MLSVQAVARSIFFSLSLPSSVLLLLQKLAEDSRSMVTLIPFSGIICYPHESLLLISVLV